MARARPHPLKALIAGQVVAIFNDRARGEAPVARAGDGMFEPGSVAARVHGDVTGMMVGGIAGLLLQMLHPAVLAGVWDHSNFRADMHGRLRRTARFIAVTTYGTRGDANAAVARVRRIHHQVTGALPDGTPYRADDPAMLAWVHATEAVSFLAGWRRYAEPAMSAADQDSYFADMAVIGRALGADPVPESRSAAESLIAAMRPQLRVDERTRAVRELVLGQRSGSALTEPIQRLTMQAGVDLLPEWARQLHALSNPALGRPLLRAGTAGIARTLRWAFR